MKHFCLFLVLAIGGENAFGLTVDPRWQENELAHAELIADFEVTSRSCSADPLLHTTCQVQATLLHVDRSVTAAGAGDLITIFQIGGERQEAGLFISGFPRPYVGQKYHAFLNRRPDGAFEIVGFEKGLQNLFRTRQWTRNRTDGTDGNGSGPFLYWDLSYFPLPFFVAAKTFGSFSDFPAAIDASFKTWRDVPDAKIEFVGLGCSSQTAVMNDGVNAVFYITHNWPYSAGIIALTRNFYISGNTPQSGMIMDSDILLNGVDHDFTTTGEPGKFDVQNIVTHEAGHFIGLGHEIPPYDTSAAMYATALPDEITKRVLKGDDIAALKSGYGGTGKKFDFPHETCHFSDSGNVGCASVHGGQTRSALNFFFCLAFIFGAGIAIRHYAKLGI